MNKKVWTSDVTIVAGLAIVVLSAKLASGTLPQVSEWVSGLTANSPERDAGESELTRPGGQFPQPIVVEAPSAPIIVLPPSNQQSGTCPAS